MNRVEPSEWKIVGRDHASVYFHMAAYCLAETSRLQPIIGKNDDLICDCKNGSSWRWSEHIADFTHLGELTLKKLEDKKFFKTVIDKNELAINAVQKFAHKLEKTDLSKKSNAELAKFYVDLFDLWVEMNLWGHVVNLADFEHFLLSTKINAFLEKRIAAAKLSYSVSEIFGILATPNQRSEVQTQDVDLLKILAEIEKNSEAEKLFKKSISEISIELPKFPKLKKLINQHIALHKWSQFHYDGPTVLDERYFVENLSVLVKENAKASEKQSEILNHGVQVKQKQIQLVKELKLSEEDQYWVEVARQFAHVKALRKDIVAEASGIAHFLIREIAKRLNLTPKQVKFSTHLEIAEALSGKELDVAEINRRLEYCVITATDKVEIYTGEKAMELAKFIREPETSVEVTEIRGSAAYPGKVIGTVKIIARAGHMSKFHKGDVLVSPATNPNLLPIMKIAGAIVTDEGGVTCHAAIVSRELKIPCVIGTKVATKWLKDGDKVEVDANKGIVKKL